MEIEVGMIKTEEEINRNAIQKKKKKKKGCSKKEKKNMKEAERGSKRK